MDRTFELCDGRTDSLERLIEENPIVENSSHSLLAYNIMLETPLLLLSGSEHTMLCSVDIQSTEKREEGDRNSNHLQDPSETQHQVVIAGQISKDRYYCNEQFMEENFDEPNTIETRLSLAIHLLDEASKTEKQRKAEKKLWKKFAKSIGFNDMFQCDNDFAKGQDSDSTVEIQSSSSSVFEEPSSNDSFVNIQEASYTQYSPATATINERFLKKTGIATRLDNGYGPAIVCKYDYEILKDNIDINRPEDLSTFEEVGKEIPKPEIVMKLYNFDLIYNLRINKATESDEEFTMSKREFLKEFNKEVIEAEINANRRIRNYNNQCYISNKPEEMINVPTFITSGFVLKDIENDTSTNEDGDRLPEQTGAFIAMNFIPDLHYLETPEDWDECSKLLSRLHTAVKVAHYDISPSNVQRNTNGDIFILDFNLSIDLEPLKTKFVNYLTSDDFYYVEKFKNQTRLWMQSQGIEC